MRGSLTEELSLKKSPWAGRLQCPVLLRDWMTSVVFYIWCSYYASDGLWIRMTSSIIKHATQRENRPWALNKVGKNRKIWKMPIQFPSVTQTPLSQNLRAFWPQARVQRKTLLPSTHIIHQHRGNRSAPADNTQVNSENCGTAIADNAQHSTGAQVKPF